MLTRAVCIFQQRLGIIHSWYDVIFANTFSSIFGRRVVGAGSIRDLRDMRSQIRIVQLSSSVLGYQELRYDGFIPLLLTVGPGRIDLRGSKFDIVCFGKSGGRSHDSIIDLVVVWPSLLNIWLRVRLIVGLDIWLGVRSGVEIWLTYLRRCVGE